MAYVVYSHSNLHGVLYFAYGSPAGDRVRRMKRMGDFMIEHAGTFNQAEDAHSYARRRAAAKGVPVLASPGFYIEDACSGRYWPSVSAAAEALGIDSHKAQLMVSNKLYECTARSGEPVRLRYLAAKRPKPQPRRGRPIGSKDSKPRPARAIAAPPAPEPRVPARPPGRPSTATRTLGRPDTTGWPALTWDVLPHPSGYVAWRAAVRDCGGYALRHTAWFPSHAAADRFALAVAGA